MNLQLMLEREEGRKLVAYADTRSIFTIGIGHTGPEVHAGLVWTDDQVDAAFDADVTKATAGCTANLPWFSALDEPRQAVLVGMAFQLGIHGLLEFTHTLAAVRDGRFADAQAGMKASAWNAQTPARAERMERQMLTGDWS